MLSYDLNGNLIATSGRLTVHDSRNRLSAWSGNTFNPSTGQKLLHWLVFAAARLRL